MGTCIPGLLVCRYVGLGASLARAPCIPAYLHTDREKKNAYLHTCIPTLQEVSCIPAYLHTRSAGMQVCGFRGFARPRPLHTCIPAYRPRKKTHTCIPAYQVCWYAGMWV